MGVWGSKALRAASPALISALATVLGGEAAMAPFAALLAVVLAWGLVSERLARYSITLPIVLVAMGAVLSATQVVLVELGSEAVRILVELALSILLFADATER